MFANDASVTPIRRIRLPCLTLLVLVLFVAARSGHGAEEFDSAHWIWISPDITDGEVVYFRKTFEIETEIRAATIAGTADDLLELWVNGERVLTTGEVNKPEKSEIGDLLRVGTNVIAARAENTMGDAALLIQCDVQLADGKVLRVSTESSWKASLRMSDPWIEPVYDDASWTTAVTLGPYGIAPWGKLPPIPVSRSTPVEAIRTLPGFKVELLYSVPRARRGSWVNLTVDPRGRLIVASQHHALYRVTPPPIGGSPDAMRIETIPIRFRGAQGLLCAFDSLYVVGDTRHGAGLFRFRDTDGDDMFDHAEPLRILDGGGEHGPHAVLLSPDGESLYVLAGNHTKLTDVNRSRFSGTPQEDLLLPRQWDPSGHARGVLAPGGWIFKTDPDGKEWELFSAGLRNPFDAAFNSHGELFTYDADMEGDIGAPWYRPTRVCHVVSASEFGWRSGTGKWPAYYPDSLPATLDIGPGSPTGVTFGYGAKFPARYQRAFFICDWSFGTMYAVHLRANGASYRAESEEFLSGRPLNLTDVVIGKDGAMYFLIGGRHSQSGLYRVTYAGSESTDAISNRPPRKRGAPRVSRGQRRRLEAFHGRPDSEAISYAWPFLDHKYRFLRYAARVAIEHQPVESWQERALLETKPLARIEALIALARQGDASLQPRIFAALGEIDVSTLDAFQTKALLRAYALTIIRMGEPDAATKRSLARHLESFYPTKDNEVNREFGRVLVALEAPTVIDKTLALLGTVPVQLPPGIDELLARNDFFGKGILETFKSALPAEDIHHVFVLRNRRYGWTLDQREKYFRWFADAQKKGRGTKYEGFLQNIKTEALANVSDAERAQLAEILGEDPGAPPPPPEIPAPHGPGREWAFGDLMALVQNGLSQRNFANGERAYAAARCASCHRFVGRGGIVGPDLTNAAGRFGYREVLESIFEPNKVISDQYVSNVLVTSDGSVHVGRIVRDDDDSFYMSTDPLSPYELTTVAKRTVVSNDVSKTSSMPDKLLDPLNQDEVLDLLAYVLSQGDPGDPSFK